MTIEAMKLALEALEGLTGAFLDTEGSHGDVENNAMDAGREAITAIKEALAEQTAQQQEPVAWATQMNEYGHIHWGAKRPEYPMVYEFPLYMPPQTSKPWVGLTRDERMSIINRLIGQDWVYALDAIEAKLKEKNA